MTSIEGRRSKILARRPFGTVPEQLVAFGSGSVDVAVGDRRVGIEAIHVIDEPVPSADIVRSIRRSFL